MEINMTTKKPASSPNPPIPGKGNENPDPVATPEQEIKTSGISVRALFDGYRRAGRRWTIAEQIVPVGEFTADQIKALLSDPRLAAALIPAE
jgi:hypothetical protein